jgi:hypothetical protein
MIDDTRANFHVSIEFSFLGLNDILASLLQYVNAGAEKSS